MGYKKWTNSQSQLQPDNKYGSLLIAKFINAIMLDGKKSTATRVMYDALDIVGKRITDDPPDEVFEKAVQRCKPNVEVRSKRVGGATYQVPMEVSRKRQQTLAIRVIVQNCRKKKGKPMVQCLADEMFDAWNRQGTSIQWRENTHKMAEANKLFAHFAW